MSAASAKGYAGEKPVLDLLIAHDHHLFELDDSLSYYRPRAGSVHDKGDICGLPYVISIKNYSVDRLASFVDALPRMCNAANLEAGVVWHKRNGKGNPLDWYVTTTGAMWLKFHDTYLMAGLSA